MGFGGRVLYNGCCTTGVLWWVLAGVLVGGCWQVGVRARSGYWMLVLVAEY